MKGNWDDEDVDENDVKDSWEDDDEPAPPVRLRSVIWFSSCNFFFPCPSFECPSMDWWIMFLG